ncbi:MAG: Arylsulfatase [Pseudomonadota bacterium]
MLKKLGVFLGLVLAALVLAVGGLYAKGGSAEVLLWVVKLFIRQEHAPNREVTWAVPNASEAPSQTSEGRKPPNIILIVADDLGYNDITLNGGGLAKGTVPTPHINSLAQQGANFETSYSGNATCAPSRAAMMTGRYPTRFGFEFTPTPKQFMKVIGHYKGPNQLYDAIYHADREKDLIPYETMGLPRSEITMAKMLKGQGYRTLHVGKWHLGDAPEFRSHVHGFDEALSFQHGSSLFLPENDPNVVNAQQSFDIIDKFQWAAGSFGMHFNGGEPFKPKRYVTDYLTDEAEKAIEANRKQPFFLYLAYTAPHTPLQATKEDYAALSHIEDHTLRVYAAMVRNLDRNIGRVLQSLRDKGLDDNTLVIFTSDNGGAHYVGLDGLNKPYRGWKATFFEGGIRVPLFMKWPAGIPKGVKPQMVVNHMDIFSTVAAATGAKLPSDRPIDGVNLLPQLSKPADKGPERALFWRTDTYRVIRKGDWKLQVSQNPRKNWLFNMATDPTEKINLADKEPERLASMKKELEAFNATQVKPSWPSMAEAAIAIDKNLREKMVPGDEYVYYGN